MEVMEVVLIILGIIVFVLSFLLPARKKNEVNESSKISEEAVKEIFDKEMANVKSQISGIVDETISYAIEKTERGMNRLTNEKMMAVNEYSDTVLDEINKNHKEVVFLYDMLNDKHESLKNTVSEATKIASDVKRTLKDAEITAKEVQETVNAAANSVPEFEDEFVPISPVRVEVINDSIVEERLETEDSEGIADKQEEETGNEAGELKEVKTADKDLGAIGVPKVEMDLNAVGQNGKRNSNERILELHEAGKSNMAIAKELGLGIGEVKLVIDLFEGI